ncbi:MAG: gliding motility-associated C-terminal domain-containing protein [Bacteroidota bacterium]
MKRRLQPISIFVFLFLSFTLAAQYQGNAPFVHEKGGLIINEISNGPTGTVGNRAEYIELLVIGSSSDPTAPVNLEGWIIDDNNFPTRPEDNTQGSAPGHSSFGACYRAVPPGSIIVFYNGDDRNPSIPPDDPNDGNGDGVYIISHNDPCINTCNSNPIAPNISPDPNPTYCPCTDPNIDRDVWALGLANDQDLIQIRDRCEIVNHVVYWESTRALKLVDDIEDSPVKVKIEGSQRLRVIRLVNTVSTDWNDPANFDNPDVATGESPGAANSMENQALIDQLRNGTFAYDGVIFDCEDTDAGDLIVPNNAGPDLPIFITEGDDLGAFGTNYDAADELEPDALGFSFEYAYILTQNDAPDFTIVDFNTNGNFDFSTVPPGDYLVWGFSYIQTNGTINVGQYLANVVTTIRDIFNYQECGFDANLENLTADGEPVNVIIEDRPCFTIDVDKTDNTCPNVNEGKIEIVVRDALPPLTIDWESDQFDGENEVSGLASGTYIFTITDADGCAIADTVLIGNLNDLPTVAVDWETEVCINSCSELQMSITGEAPYQIEYNLDLGSLNRDFEINTSSRDTSILVCPDDFGITSGSIFSATFFRVEDANCADTINATFVTSVLPTTEFTLNQTLCLGEAIRVNGNVYGGGRTTGREILRGASANGCDSIVVIDLTIVQPDTLFVVQDICGEESFEFNGVIYNADNPSGVELLPGENFAGCDSVIVVDLNVLQVAENEIDREICVDESIEVNGTIYDANNLIGQEVLVGGAANGCDSIININLSLADALSGTFFATLCMGESVVINGTTYDQSNPIGTERITQPSGCDSLIEVTLTFEPTIIASLIGDANVCNGEAANLTFNFNQVGSFDIRYFENDRLVELNGISDGHTLEVTPAQNTIYRIESVSSEDWKCIEIGEQAQVMVSNLEVSLSTQELSCPGNEDGSLEVNINGGIEPISIEWNTGDGSEELTNLGAGTYAVTVIDAANCLFEEQVTLEEGEMLQFIATTNAPDCLGDENGSIIIDSIRGGELPYTVTFQGERETFTNFPITFRNLQEGIYDILIEDRKGCDAAQEVEIETPTPLSLELGDNIEIDLGDSVNLVAVVSGEIESIEWFPPEMLTTPDSLASFTKPAENTVYQLSITDVNGCTISDRITVFVIDDQKIYVPNAFSPNGDNTNDFFTVFPDSKVASIPRLQVYDRWGNLLFDRANPAIGKESDGWNGRINGNRAPSGNYVYRVEIEYVSGETEVLVGTVSLL